MVPWCISGGFAELFLKLNDLDESEVNQGPVFAFVVKEIYVAPGNERWA